MRSRLFADRLQEYPLFLGHLSKLLQLRGHLIVIDGAFAVLIKPLDKLINLFCRQIDTTFLEVQRKASPISIV